MFMRTWPPGICACKGFVIETLQATQWAQPDLAPQFCIIVSIRDKGRDESKGMKTASACRWTEEECRVQARRCPPSLQHAQEQRDHQGTPFVPSEASPVHLKAGRRRMRSYAGLCRRWREAKTKACQSCNKSAFIDSGWLRILGRIVQAPQGSA